MSEACLNATVAFQEAGTPLCYMTDLRASSCFCCSIALRARARSIFLCSSSALVALLLVDLLTAMECFKQQALSNSENLSSTFLVRSSRSPHLFEPVAFKATLNRS